MTDNWRRRANKVRTGSEEDGRSARDLLTRGAVEGRLMGGRKGEKRGLALADKGKLTN